MISMLMWRSLKTMELPRLMKKKKMKMMKKSIKMKKEMVPNKNALLIKWRKK
jgi:hypothetical protein